MRIKIIVLFSWKKKEYVLLKTDFFVRLWNDLSMPKSLLGISGYSVNSILFLTEKQKTAIRNGNTNRYCPHLQLELCDENIKLKEVNK